MNRKLGILAIVIANSILPGALSADPLLETEFRKVLAQDSLAVALSTKQSDFVRSLAEVECAYHAENAETALSAMADGMTLAEIKNSVEQAGEPTLVEEFIERQLLDSSNGADASTKAKIVLKVESACKSATEHLISAIE